MRLGSDSGSKKFFQVALKDFLHVGTFFASSHWATEHMTSHLPVPCRRVVEYGAGDGRLTKRLLEKMPRESKLYSIELNPLFINKLRTIPDPRLQVVAGNVLDLSQRLETVAGGEIDAVFCGIPFSFIPEEKRNRILEGTRKALRGRGRFVVYQNSLLMRKPLARCFGAVQVALEPRNLPPYFIMVATR